MQEKFKEITNKIETIKTGFAEAISAKGVETAPNAPFQTMIDNIGNISVGGSEEPTVEEWVKPHDWIDIESEPLETGEVRVLMCDLFGKNNNTIYFARRTGATNIKASIDWGDGTQEEVNVASGNTTVNHNFIGDGTPCDRGYNMYVVRIRFNEPSSAPYWMYFYRSSASSANNIHNNLLWIYGDMQYFTNLSNMTCHTSYYSMSVLLERVNLINTNNITNMNNMFRHCHSLQSLPQLDTSSNTGMGYMFNSCYSLKSLPQLDTSKVTSMSYAFANCYSLKTIQQLDMSNVSNLNVAFNGCYSLQSISFSNANNVLYTNTTFAGCSSLRYIPPLNTSNSTNVSGIFSGCRLLLKSPPLDTRKAVGSSSNNNHFTNCDSLIEVGTITLSKDIQLAITSSRGLRKIDLAYDETDIPIFTQTVPIKINYTQLSSDELNKLMTQLPDGNGKTLDLKYNRGSLECDPSIATAKNWTVLVN